MGPNTSRGSGWSASTKQGEELLEGDPVLSLVATDSLKIFIFSPLIEAAALVAQRRGGAKDEVPEDLMPVAVARRCSEELDEALDRILCP